MNHHTPTIKTVKRFKNFTLLRHSDGIQMQSEIYRGDSTKPEDQIGAVWYSRNHRQINARHGIGAAVENNAIAVEKGESKQKAAAILETWVVKTEIAHNPETVDQMLRPGQNR